MRTYYRIVDIVHSGRKGIRGEQVTDAKYDGLIGCRATLDITEIERFKPVKITFREMPSLSTLFWIFCLNSPSPIIINFAVGYSFKKE